MTVLQTNFPGEFIHALDARNWLPCYNLKLNPILMSPDFMARSDRGMSEVHQSLRDAPIECLESGPFPIGTVTPRSGNIVLPGTIVRRGDKIGIGVENTKWIPDATQKEIMRRADIEITFEKMRREIAPDAASRLSCLWLAEDTPDGNTHLKEMFGDNAPIRIMKVRIPQYLRVTRTDTACFDRYLSCEEQTPQVIENYWKGVSLSENNPKWEFLVEGVIEFDPEQVHEVYELARSLSTWPEGLAVP